MVCLLLGAGSGLLVPSGQMSTGGWLQTAAADESLAVRQSAVAKRFQKLEELLLRLADVEAAENPERSALLRRAARQASDRFVLDRLRNAGESIRSQEFQDAIDRQEEANEELQSLLKLLLSEDRSRRIRDEKDRVAELIKQLRRTERSQRSTRARTESGADIEELQREQKAITERADNLNRELAEQESEEASGSANGSEDSAPSDVQPDPAEDESDSDPADAEPNPAEGSDGEQESESGEQESESNGPSDPQEGPQSEEDPSPGEPSEGSPDGEQSQQEEPQDGEQSQQGEPSPPSQEQTPSTPQQRAEQRLDDAIERMREAEQRLEEAKREDAVEEQREAEENLRNAIDELERILRQLREEEMERELARLESRLRKMAAMQSQVLDDCVALAATPESQRDRQTDLKAGELAFEEKKITHEADRAMLLLREEGSSVAFPEVLTQIRSDTVRVSQRLEESKIDAVTQGIQEDVLAALEEMIDALQKAQKDLEEQRQQQQQQGQPPQQGPGEQPLVQALAELKLIRTMETRIKSTTERYGDLLESGETSGSEVRPMLQSLAERQDRLFQITRDLVLKQNE